MANRTIIGVPGEIKTLKVDTTKFTENDGVTIVTESIDITIFEAQPTPTKASLSMVGAVSATLLVEYADKVRRVKVPALEGVVTAKINYTPSSFDTDVKDKRYQGGSLVVDEEDWATVQFQVLVPPDGVEDEVRITIPFSTGEKEITTFRVIGDKENG